MKKLFLVLVTVLSLGASSLAMANEVVVVPSACAPVKRVVFVAPHRWVPPHRVVVVAPPVFHPYRFYHRVALVRDGRFWHNHYGYRYF
jgi:hypothetical protein